jgi:hypothetical protein
VSAVAAHAATSASGIGFLFGCSIAF